MAKREIKFSLVYRDMWQSSGKYVPRVDQLVEVAPAIIDMGCFDRVETNGGAFEQVNLLFGENPNKAVRAWTAPFHKAGIQTHMLERGLNALRMNPVPLDVRELMEGGRIPLKGTKETWLLSIDQLFAGGPVHHLFPRAHRRLLHGYCGQGGGIRRR